MSSKTTHDAIVEDVRKLTDNLDFDDAVALIAANPNLSTSSEEKLLFASAYAGKCGLTFAGIFDSLSSASGSPMEFAKDAFTHIAVSPDDCYTAQQWIAKIGTVANRTTDQNMAMFLIGLGKVGTYLRNRADANMDGVLDAGYDSCSSAKLPGTDVKQVISGFALMIENINALGSSLSGGMAGAISSMTAACTALGLASCTNTDPTTISDSDADSFRDAIKSDKTTLLGIESCVTVPMTSCCP
jgi:hypothetical protein